MANKPYSLYCLLPSQLGSGAVDSDYADLATRYRHSTRWQGGFWEASWFFPLGEHVTDLYLRDWFENRLAFRHSERIGSLPTWEGYIWVMDLTLEGFTERVDMSELYNAIKTIYRDSAGAQQETSFYTDDDSIDRYGRREFVLTLDHVAAAEAQAAAQTLLTAKSLPSPRPVAIDPRDQDGLAVTAVGDVFTMNNKLVTAGDGTTDNISDYISDIISTDCEFVSEGVIDTNTLQILKETDLPTRAWDLLLRLTEAGDASDNPWRFTVEGGKAAYQQADNTPLYMWMGREQGLVAQIGPDNPWQMRPGVLRNTTRIHSSWPSTSFFQSGRDILIEEIEMGDLMPFPHMRPTGVNESDIQAGQRYFSRILQQEGHE
jgi:hypothetical protein